MISLKTELNKLLMNEGEKVFIDRTDFFLILRETHTKGYKTLFYYDNGVSVPFGESYNPNPTVKLCAEMDSLVDGSMGLQLHFSQNNIYNNYVTVGINVSEFDTDKQVIKSGYECSIEYDFDGDLNERGVTFRFKNCSIYIPRIDEKTFKEIINRLPEERIQYIEESEEQNREYRDANASMPEGFWEGIDNMMEK
jgi:hypothetical protein